MKKLLMLLAMLSSQADAGTLQIGGQWDIPPGGHNQLSCISPPSYSQCVKLPPGVRVLGWQGSQTIKAPSIEVLAGAACDGQVLWTYEHFQGTYIITSPAKVATSIAGTCSAYWETGNNSGRLCPSCLEINVTIFYCIPGLDCPP